MACETFAPQQFNEAGETRDGFGIVLLNHAGSTLAQDTGRDARVLANTFGVPVVAVDRPGTGRWWPNRELAQFLSTPSGYVIAMANLGERINDELAEAGVQRTLVMGRSAGGLGALALTTSSAIESQVAVYAAEPVGCYQTTVDKGKQLFRTYGGIQKQMINSEPDLVKPEPPHLGPLARLGRLASMGPDNLFDRYHSRGIWASDAAKRYMEEIAARQPDISMAVDFADVSLVVGEPQFKALAKSVTGIRNTVLLERVSKTVHASFDNRKFMAGRVQLIIDRLLGAS